MNENVKELKAVETTATKQNLHITLEYYARQEAIKALTERGMEIRENFDGPIFKDIAGHQVGTTWVAVMLKDGTTYVYPTTSVARLKVYNS